MRKIAFEIFDVNKDKKLSENDMFDLMKLCNGNKEKGEKKEEAQLLPIDQ